MRSVAFVMLTPLLACTATAQHVDPPPPDGQTTTDGGGDTPPPAHGFQLMVPQVGRPIDINPGDDITYCFSVQTPNTGELDIQRWTSHMPPGVHDMIVYLTQTDPGTPSPTTDCGLVARASSLFWTYAAQTADAEATLPSDDGTGKPVAQLVKSRQWSIFQIHYVNTGTTVLHPSIELNAYAYPDGTQITFAAPFMTFNENISIMPGSQAQPATGMVNGSCMVPLDSTGKPPRFFGMTSHTYKQGINTFVKDGVDMVLDNTDWEHPSTSRWPVMPFYTFKSGTLFYQCEYSNPTDRTIKTGDDAKMDELCMTIGFFFPAPTEGIYRGLGHFCSNSVLIF